MKSEFLGETKISTNELSNLSAGSSRKLKIFANLILFGIACFAAWLIFPVAAKHFNQAREGLSNSRGLLDSLNQNHSMLQPSPSLIIIAISLASFAYLLSRYLYQTITKPSINSDFAPIGPSYIVLFGSIFLFGALTIPTYLIFIGLFANGADDVQSAFDNEFILFANPVLTLFVWSFVLFALLALKLMYTYGIKPVTKMLVRGIFKSKDASNNKNQGAIKYTLDRYGLEYGIEFPDVSDRFKLYWRNFTHAEYAPDIIRLYKGRKQIAFILMRAFPGQEIEVGQFVEATLNKVFAKKA